MAETTATISDDAIQAGIEEVLGCAVTPFADPQGKVWFRIQGDHEGVLHAIYENKPVGSLDVLKSIKALRQAIFSLKGHGNGRTQNGYRTK